MDCGQFRKAIFTTPLPEIPDMCICTGTVCINTDDIITSLPGDPRGTYEVPYLSTVVCIGSTESPGAIILACWEMIGHGIRNLGTKFEQNW